MTGIRLRDAYEAAVTWVARTRQAANEMTSTFSREAVVEWEALRTTYHSDPLAHANRNPYREPEPGNHAARSLRLQLTNDLPVINMAKIRRDLAEQEGAVEVPAGKLSPGEFVRQGIDLSLRLYVDVTSTTSCQANACFRANWQKVTTKRSRTDLQIAINREKESVLLNACNGWIDLCKYYSPGSEAAEEAHVRARPAKYVAKGLDIRLWLPSQLSPSARKQCLHGIVKIEFNYRVAQAVTALLTLRNARRLRLRLWDKYRHNLAGEGTQYQTRTRAPINATQDRITTAYHTYQQAWTALVSLDPDGTWREIYGLRELKPEDNRGPTPRADELTRDIAKQRATNHAAAAATSTTSAAASTSTLLADASEIEVPYEVSNSRYIPSWIWTVRPANEQPGDEDSEEPEYHEQVRSEWCNSQARAERWEEEEALLGQEMYRTLLSLRTQRQDWLARATRRQVTDGSLADGLAVYAHERADVMLSLANYFVALWTPLLTHDARALPDWWNDGTSWLAAGNSMCADPPGDCEVTPATSPVSNTPTSPASSSVTNTTSSSVTNATSPSVLTPTASTSTTPAASTASATSASTTLAALAASAAPTAPASTTPSALTASAAPSASASTALNASAALTPSRSTTSDALTVSGSTTPAALTASAVHIASSLTTSDALAAYASTTSAVLTAYVSVTPASVSTSPPLPLSADAALPFHLHAARVAQALRHQPVIVRSKRKRYRIAQLDALPRTTVHAAAAEIATSPGMPADVVTHVTPLVAVLDGEQCGESDMEDLDDESDVEEEVDMEEDLM
jgi:hypothetical protein